MAPRPAAAATMMFLAQQVLLCAGTILHNSNPHPTSPGVVIFTHYDKQDWRQRCAPLLFSLEKAKVDYVIGFLDESTFPGVARRHKECMKDKECTYREDHHIFNNMNKFIWAYEVLTSGEVHPDSLVVFADCTDAYLMCSASELERKFESYHADVVHASEFHLWPFDRLFKLIRKRVVPNPYPQSSTPLRYGNTGHYAGRARSLLAYFERMRREWETGTPWTWCCPTGVRYVLPSYQGADANQTDCFNDQRCIHTFVAAGFHKDGRGPSLVFDETAELFLSASKMGHRVTVRGPRIEFNLSQALAPTTGRWSGQKWRASKPSSWPCWIHCSGASKAFYPKVTEVLMAAARKEEQEGRGSASSMSWNARTGFSGGASSLASAAVRRVLAHVLPAGSSVHHGADRSHADEQQLLDSA